MVLLRPLTILGVVVALAAGCGGTGGDTPTPHDAGPGPVDNTDASTVPDASVPDTRKEPPIVVPMQNIIVETIAGSATAGDADGVGSAATFDNPVGVVIDASGDLLVTEYDGGRVRKLPLSGSTSTLVSGLKEPFAILPTEDAIYIQSDRDANGNKGDTTATIWKVPLTGGTPELFVAGLAKARGLARLLDGRVVVSERGRNKISILDLTTKVLTPLAGSGAAATINNHGADASFNDPYGVAVLPDGSILVAEAQGHVIRRVTVEGDVTTFAGDGLPGMRDDADKMKARFDGPVDVAVDAAGNVFVCDGGNRRIRHISTDGVVETLAGNGARGFADGIGSTAMFYGQEEIDVTPDGKTIYVSDGNGGDGEPFHRIRRVVIP